MCCGLGGTGRTRPSWGCEGSRILPAGRAPGHRALTDTDAGPAGWACKREIPSKPNLLRLGAAAVLNKGSRRAHHLLATARLKVDFETVAEM